MCVCGVGGGRRRGAEYSVCIVNFFRFYYSETSRLGLYSKGDWGGGGGATRPLKEIKEMFIIISEVARSNSGCTFLLKETKLSINIIFKSGNKT